ncbi:MAG TPA: hypothetical protein VFT80_14230 [Actinomycetota bacterium]|nr:hypothetical protein [Actinomycetota bacterium]
MAGSSKEAWDEVGERFATFGRALAARYKQLEQERGATTDEDKRKIEEAFSTITRQLDQAFTSLGETIRDPSAKDDLKQAARSVGDALTVTFQEVSEEVRKRIGRSEPAGTAPERPDASTGETEAAPPTGETEAAPPKDETGPDA